MAAEHHWSLVALLTACVACGAGISGEHPRAASELDPRATFAAHQVHAGFVLDRLQPDATGVV
jgi:hypothetical protein